MTLLGERCLLIANPGARRGGRLIEPATRAFHRAGVSLDVLVTEAPGHGGSVAREVADRYDLIFTLGGDGTAMEVVGALLGTNRSVGVLPGGTGNLIARALRTPLDVRKAVPALLHGTRARIDLGILGDGRAFAISAGAGLDAEMIATAPLSLRRKLGVLTYFATASRSMLSMRPFSVRATVDGTVIEREDCMVAMVVNLGSVLGGRLELGPGISHEDGLLDLCVYRAPGVAAATAVAVRVLLKRFGDTRHMTFVRGKHISIATIPDRECQADGELIGRTPISARIAPMAAPLLVPRRFG